MLSELYYVKYINCICPRVLCLGRETFDSVMWEHEWHEAGFCMAPTRAFLAPSTSGLSCGLLLRCVAALTLVGQFLISPSEVSVSPTLESWAVFYLLFYCSSHWGSSSAFKSLCWIIVKAKKKWVPSILFRWKNERRWWPGHCCGSSLELCV